MWILLRGRGDTLEVYFGIRGYWRFGRNFVGFWVYGVSGSL